ncbi:MAG: hypothetical protein AAGA54_13515 [Myxococcota bacterium]
MAIPRHPVDQNLATARPLPSTPTVTTGDLFSPQVRGPSHIVSGPRTLTVGDVPLATVGADTTRLNPLTATSAEGMPAVEILAAIASQNPSGVLVIELGSGGSGFGFELQSGRIVGARGPGRLGQLERWCAEVHQRFPRRFGNHPPDASGAMDPLWLDIARDFIREHAIEFLEASATPGTRMTLLRGDVTWLGTTIPSERAPSLQHLLLEQARRHDELPRLEKKLGDLRQTVLPMHEPGKTPPGGKPTTSGAEDEWDLDGPDPATTETWTQARLLWSLCDGQHSIAELIDLSLLGRFRTLAAVSMLAESQCVIVIEPQGAATPRPVASPPPPPLAKRSTRPIPLRPPPPPTRPRSTTNVVSLPLTPERPSPAADTGYSMTRKATNRPPAPPRRGTPPRPPSRANVARVEAAPDKRVVSPEPQPTRRVPTRTVVPSHSHIVTPRPASQRNAVSRTQPSVNDIVDAEVSALDLAAFDADDGDTATSQPAPRRDTSWQLIALAIVGALLFAGGAAFSLALSRTPQSASDGP